MDINFKDSRLQPIIFTQDSASDKDVYAAYKPVHRKVRPVPAVYPEDIKVKRQIPVDPLLDLPKLSPTNFQAFVYTDKLTKERMLLFNIKSNKFLWEEEKKLLERVVGLLEELWAFDESERGWLKDEYFSPYIIPVEEHVPWEEKNIKIPAGIRERVMELLKEKIAAGVYERSESSYRSRWFCVVKKSGDLRIVHDLQPLNAVTIRNAGLVPVLDDFVEAIAGRSVYTVFDLFSGYNARKLAIESRDLTAFYTPLGCLRLTCLPQGLTTAVSEFQECMVFILQDEIPAVTNPFVDDVPVKGPATRYVQEDGSYEVLVENPGIRRFIWEHLLDVLRVGHRIKKAGGTISPSKIQLAQPEVVVLGQTCTIEGRSPEDRKISKIVKWPVPTNVKQVRGFLGLCGTVRIWIKDYSLIARPMVNLTKKDVWFRWTPDCQRSMDILKERITKAPVLRPIDYGSEREVIMEVDTSKIAVGYILVQLDENGKRRVARYGSLPMNERESRYSQPMLELYGLFRALRSWRVFIIGVKNLVVEMDAKYIKGMLNAPDIQPNAAVNRWIYAILLFNFKLRHVSAKNFQGPDGLSRRPSAEDDSEDDTSEVANKWLDELLDFRIHADDRAYPSDKEFQQHWVFVTRTSDLEDIQRFLETGQMPRLDSFDAKKKFLAKLRFFFVEDGKLWRRMKGGKRRVIIEESKRRGILEQAHDKLGHRGVYAIFSMVSLRFWWPSLSKDVKHYVKTCHQCQIRSVQKVEIPITVSTPATIFTKIYLDIMRMPEAKGYKYIVAARDDLSGAAVGRKLKEATAVKVAEFIWEKIYLSFGCVGQITTDNGPELQGATSRLMDILGIPHIKIMPYNSKANGVVERGHFTIRESIVKLCEEDINKWPDYVDVAFFADMVTTRRATGLSPFYMLYGVDPVLPFDLFEATYLVSGFKEEMTSEELLALRIRQLMKKEEDMAKAAEVLAKSRYRSKEEFEKRYKKRIKNYKFKKGDLVLVRNSAVEMEMNRKTKNRYLGPYRIIRKTEKGSYVLEELDGTPMRKGVAGFRLIPYHLRDGAPLAPDELSGDEGSEGEAESSGENSRREMSNEDGSEEEDD
jgi:hypothetical protein